MMVINGTNSEGIREPIFDELAWSEKYDDCADMFINDLIDDLANNYNLR
jgi:hypothetical protein